MRSTLTHEVCTTPSSSVWSRSRQGGGSAKTADAHNPSRSNENATLDNKTVFYTVVDHSAFLQICAMPCAVYALYSAQLHFDGKLEMTRKAKQLQVWSCIEKHNILTLGVRQLSTYHLSVVHHG